MCFVSMNLVSNGKLKIQDSDVFLKNVRIKNKLNLTFIVTGCREGLSGLLSVSV